MKNLILILLLFMTIWGTENKNPYRNIEFHTLKNGIDVILLPSDGANNVKIIASFEVGMLDEKEGNYEITHFLEHLLFRDSRLDNNNTYMQLIEQKGGMANGYTTIDETSYEGTVPKKEGEWLLDVFSKMLLDRKIEKDDLPKEKKTIRLELGEPDWFSKKFGFDLIEWFYIKIFWIPDNEESEFGIVYPDIFFSKDDRVLSLEKIKYEDVIKYYKKFYYPKNMAIFVSGNFDKIKYLELIKEKFEKFENHSSAISKKLKTNFVQKPFIKIDSFKKYLTINYGIKFNDASLKEETILSIYNDYLAYRLMKKLRNEKAQTYTVSQFYGNYSDYDTHKFDGFIGVEFETNKNDFFKNLILIKTMIDDETKNGKISDEIIEKSIKFYRQKFELVSYDAETLMDMAIRYYKNYKTFGQEIDDYKLLNSIDEEEFRKVLKKFYNNNSSYQSYNRPPLFNEIEHYIIIAVSLIFSLWFFYRIFNREIDWTKITYIKNLTYSPLAIIESIIIFSIIIFISEFLLVYTEHFLKSSIWFNDINLYLYYLYTYISISIFLFIGLSFWIPSYFTKTILIENNKLVIKSFSIYCKKISFNDIETITTNTDVEMVKNLLLLLNPKFKFSVYNPFFWQKRLTITLKNGQIFYLSIKNAEKIAEDLKKLIKI